MHRRSETAKIAGRANVWGLCFAAAAAATLSGGCQEYLDRRDPVTLGVGDANAYNKATQTINRWPRAAHEDRWLSDGERARMAVQRYKTDKVKNPKALDTDQVQAAPDATAQAKGGKAGGK